VLLKYVRLYLTYIAETVKAVVEFLGPPFLERAGEMAGRLQHGDICMTESTIITVVRVIVLTASRSSTVDKTPRRAPSYRRPYRCGCGIHGGPRKVGEVVLASLPVPSIGSLRSVGSQIVSYEDPDQLSSSLLRGPISHVLQAHGSV